jgi:hypothetical protein
MFQRAYKYKAFISYASEDHELARSLKQKLKADRYECFVAEDEMRVGEEWKKRLRQEMAEAEHLILLYSVAGFAKQGGWLKTELNWFEGMTNDRREVPGAQERKVMTVLLDADKPPDEVSTLHAVDDIFKSGHYRSSMGGAGLPAGELPDETIAMVARRIADAFSAQKSVATATLGYVCIAADSGLIKDLSEEQWEKSVGNAQRCSLISPGAGVSELKAICQMRYRLTPYDWMPPSSEGKTIGSLIQLKWVPDINRRLQEVQRRAGDPRRLVPRAMEPSFYGQHCSDADRRQMLCDLRGEQGLLLIVVDTLSLCLVCDDDVSRRRMLTICEGVLDHRTAVLFPSLEKVPSYTRTKETLKRQVNEMFDRVFARPSYELDDAIFGINVFDEDEVARLLGASFGRLLLPRRGGPAAALRMTD